MNKLFYIFLSVLFVCSPAHARERPDEMERIKARTVEIFYGSTIRRDRVRDDSRYRHQRKPYCVTYKVTDEYGYVHYFEQCR